MSKFSDDTCEALYIDGFLEDECGDVNECGEWYGLLTDTGIDDAKHAIIREDDQGFVTYDTYESRGHARKEFERIATEIAAESEEATSDD